MTAPAELDVQALRFPGERTMLRRTVAALALLYLLFIGLTLSLFLGWLAIAFGTVWVLRSRYQSDSIEVGAGQLPQIQDVVERCAGRLGVPAPRLFLSSAPGAWPVFTVPLPRPSIVMSSWWVRHLEPRELEFFVYHELAHGLAGHRTLMNPITVLENVGAVSWVLATPLEVARYVLRPWMRLADFSADRIALAAMDGDLEAVSAALAKVTAGDELCDRVSGEGFLAQSRGLQGGVALYLHEITSGKLGTARRLAEMARFAGSSAFQTLVHGREPPPRRLLDRIPLVRALRRPPRELPRPTPPAPSAASPRPPPTPSS